MIKSKFKRVTSLFLATLMCVTTFAGIGSTTAHAASGEKADVYMVDFPRDGDANYDGVWGHSNLTLKNGWHTGRSNFTNLKAIGSYSGNVAYCIEPGISLKVGQTMNKYDENYFNTQTNGRKAPAVSANRDPKALITTMLDVSPVEVASTDELPYPNMAAFYNNEKQTLYVKRNVGDSVAVAQCVAQELGHAQLSINSESYSRRDMGFQAVCIGFMLCKKYGVDTQNFAINRIPEGLASKEPKEIRAELSKTRNAMAEIHSHISDEMFRKKQERSKDYER